MADSKKYDGSQWEHSLRKLTTATEAVENPLYSDGTAITSYTIKGNTVQNGTPTPSNPVEVNGVGVRTENLWDGNYINAYVDAAQYKFVNAGTNAISALIRVEPNTTYTVKKYDTSNRFLLGVAASVPTLNMPLSMINTDNEKKEVTFTTESSTNYLVAYVSTGTEQAEPRLMINEGSTAKPYEPYGYKIPISNGQQTTNIYLGSTQTTRKIKKLVLYGTEDWQYNSQYGVIYGSFVSDYLKIGAIICASSHFEAQQNVTSISQAQDGVSFMVSNQYDRIYIKNSQFDNANTFKQWLAAQYAAGTPVTVYYILATATTGTVNEPLMKIGDYADTLSNATAIPTTDGANSISVDTTVQPSEFTATWTGWHDASVKEWDGSIWQ